MNVHPRKAEVRFAQERSVYQAVSQAVSQALLPFPVEVVGGVPGWPFPETPIAPARVAEGAVAYDVGQRTEALGQVLSTYIVARTFDGLVIVDQHAAHEAVLTERMLAGGGAKPLSPPHSLELTPREADLLMAYLGLYADLGWEVESFRGISFLVRALPGALDGQDAALLLAGLLEDLAAGQNLDPDALREKLANRSACWVAVKAGDLLTREEQQALLDALLEAWSPTTCPHGRPVLFTLGIEEMERRFLRR